MNPPLIVLKAVARMLRARQVPFAVVGGMAVIARGYARATRDADVLVVSNELALLVRAAPEFDLAGDSDREDLIDLGLARLHLATGPVSHTDLMTPETEFERQVVARATDLDLGGIVLPVATVEDLILLKLAANRPQDIVDVLALKDGLGAGIDWALLHERGPSAGVADRVALYFGPPASGHPSTVIKP